MPTETKNVALKRICSGSTSPSACWLKRLSLTTRPARKAPSDRLTPARLVRKAVPKQMAMTVSRNSSGEQVRATCSSTIGIRRRAISSTAAMMSPALASAQAIAPAEPPPPASIGTSSTITTTARSWKIRMPRPRLAVRAVGLAAIGEQLEHDGRRAEGDEEAGEQAAAPVDAEEGEEHQRADGGESDLQAAGGEDGALHLGELLETELDADREEEEHDADFRRGVDQRRVVHEAESVRADHHARHQEADDGNQAETKADVGDAGTGQQKRDCISEVSVLQERCVPLRSACRAYRSSS